MMNNLNLVYFSATGGTKKVMKGIANGIGNVSNEYDITLLENRQNPIVFNSDDFVIVGVPVYAGRVPLFLVDYFASVKGNNTPVVLVAVYGNRDYDDALLELRDIFTSNGFVAVSAGAFVAEHSMTAKVGTNRPDVHDLEIANRFGSDISNKLEKLASVKNLPELNVKGHFPYKERMITPPMVPATSDECTKCGICAKYCPMEAIDKSNFKDIDATKCIRCCSCIKKCPVQAKHVDHEMYHKITNNLIDNFSTIRKEPECFW